MNNAEPSLVDKIKLVHGALASNRIAHAFGGALALAYYTNDPRATADIDVNISLPAGQAKRCFEALPLAINATADDRARASADDQVRLWWGRTPIDLFFRASEFHDGVAQRIVWHDFAGERLPFISANDLAVFKALFDRPKDWLDIANMLEASAIDAHAVERVLRALLGDDSRVERIKALRSKRA